MTQRPTARGRIKLPRMNQTEQRYAQYLEIQKRAGEILEFWFEGITLKLAHDCRYTPDFLVMLPDDTLRCEEVKGFWRDDAKVKLRVAAKMFPFRFVAVYADGRDGWKWEEF